MDNLIKSPESFSKQFLPYQVQKVASILGVALTKETSTLIAQQINKSNRKAFQHYNKQYNGSIPPQMFYMKLANKASLDAIPYAKAQCNKFINGATLNANPFNANVDLTRPALHIKGDGNKAQLTQDLDKFKQDYYKALSPAPAYNSGLIDPTTGKPLVGPEFFRDPAYTPRSRGNSADQQAQQQQQAQAFASNGLSPFNPTNQQAPQQVPQVPLGIGSTQLDNMFANHTVLDAVAMGNNPNIRTYGAFEAIGSGNLGPDKNDPRVGTGTISLDQYQAQRNTGIAVPQGNFNPQQMPSQGFHNRGSRKSRRRELKRIHSCVELLQDICPVLANDAIYKHTARFEEAVAPFTIDHLLLILDKIQKDQPKQTEQINSTQETQSEEQAKDLRKDPQEDQPSSLQFSVDSERPYELDHPYVASRMTINPKRFSQKITLTSENNKISLNDKNEELQVGDYSLSALVHQINTIIIDHSCMISSSEVGSFMIENMDQSAFAITNPSDSVFRLLGFCKDNYSGQYQYETDKITLAIVLNNNYGKPITISDNKPVNCEFKTPLRINSIESMWKFDNKVIHDVPLFIEFELFNSLA